MSAKPALIRVSAVACLLWLAIGSGSGPVSADGALTAKAPLPTVLLYPATPGDVAALVDLRTRLRLDARVGVLTYDPESAAIERAASEDSHPEWLVSAPVTDAGRMTLARALGAAFYAVVSPGRDAETTHVELVETAPAARTFDWSGSNRQFGVRAIESQVADAIQHPVSYVAADTSTPLTPAPSVVASSPSVVASSPSVVASSPSVVASSPSVVASSPSVVASSPSVVASSPSVVASSPTNAPIIITLPKSLTPNESTPVPLVRTAPQPLTLPVQAAQALPPPSLPPPVVTAAAPPAQINTVPTPVTAPPQVAAVPLQVTVPKVAALPVMPSPELASSPLPKITAAVPDTKIFAAVPKVEMAPLPSAVSILPKIPTTVAVVPPPTKTLKVNGPQIAMLPPPSLPAAPEPSLPMPQTENPPAPATVRKTSRKAEDISTVQPLLTKGDSALDSGDAVSAIAFYRQAINGAPLSIVPRLKLAQAYQKDGLSDRALDEARRALEIAPDSAPVQQFLSDLDQQTGTTTGALIRERAALEHRPNDPAAHVALAEALWNSGDLSSAEAEYKAAEALAPAGNHAADAQLAQLYAAEARYGDCLAMLGTSGKDGYALAIQIVKNRAETLSSTLSASRETFAARKSTREQFYDDAKKLSAEAQALAEFVSQVTPPTRYKLSHLHRMLSTNLLAQESATLVAYIETDDSQKNDSLSQLERAAATEMLTAQATEEKLGLWREAGKEVGREK